MIIKRELQSRFVLYRDADRKEEMDVGWGRGEPISRLFQGIIPLLGSNIMIMTDVIILFIGLAGNGIGNCKSLGADNNNERYEKNTP